MIHKHNRRSFLKITVTGFLSFLASRMHLRSTQPEKDRPLKEADFYKKNNLAG